MEDNAHIPGLIMVDDNALAAAAMKRRFSQSHEFRWLGWCADVPSVLPMFRAQRPDVVLLDVELPGSDSFSLLEILLAESHKASIVMFSGHDQPSLIERALGIGASGYIHKDEPTAVLVNLLQRAAKGEYVLSPLAARTYIEPDDAGSRQRTISKDRSSRAPTRWPGPADGARE